MASLKNFSQTMLLSILYPTTITINLKLMFLPSDTYIEKDSSINDEIDKLRHSATSSLLERNDVIVVASVSSIFGLGDPKEYRDQALSLRVGQELERDKLLNQLIDVQFERNDIDFQRGRFRVRGGCSRDLSCFTR